MSFPRFALLALASVISAGLHGAPAPKKTGPRQPAPVSVSSVNYASTSQEELYRLENEKLQANPATPPLKPLETPRRDVFMPGDL